MKKRAPKRGRRVAKVPRGLGMKEYTFTFNLPAQILTSGGGAGSLTLAAVTSGATLVSGANPITSTKFATQPSTNGLAGFWDLSMATNFRLADIANYTSYTGLFDAYKIRKVGLSLEYLNNSSAVNSTGLMPSVYSYWDQDDATVPANALIAQQKQGVRRFQFGNNSKTCYRTSGKPMLETALGVAGGGVAIAGISKSQFLDCLSPTIAHNALKLFVTDLYLPGSSAVTQAIRLNWTYVVTFRSPILAA